MKVLMVFVLVVACAYALPAPGTVSDSLAKAGQVADDIVKKVKDMMPAVPALPGLSPAATVSVSATTAAPAASTPAAATTAAPAATTAKKA